MSAEAGVLGTPYIRFNDFVGRISYLDELENKFKLGIGIRTKDKPLLFEQIEYFLSKNNLKEEWQGKRKIMLSEKIDLTGFLIWLIEEYPKSVETIWREKDYQKIFIV